MTIRRKIPTATEGSRFLRAFCRDLRCVIGGSVDDRDCEEILALVFWAKDSEIADRDRCEVAGGPLRSAPPLQPSKG